MATFSEYERYDAIGLAELVRERKVSARELVEAAIERSERVNPRIGAVIHPLYDEARRAAASACLTAPSPACPFSSRICRRRTRARRWQREPLLRRMGTARTLRAGAPHPRVGGDRAGQDQHAGARTPAHHRASALRPSRNPWDLAHAGRLVRRRRGRGGGGRGAHGPRGRGGGSIRIPAACCGCSGSSRPAARALGPGVSEAVARLRWITC